MVIAFIIGVQKVVGCWLDKDYASETDWKSESCLFGLRGMDQIVRFEWVTLG